MTRLLLQKAGVRSLVAGLDAIPFCTPLLTPLEVVLLSIVNIHAQVTMWYTSSNVTPTTRFTSAKLADAWVTDAWEHLRSTRLPDTDLPLGRHFASSGHSAEDMLVSVVHAGFNIILDRRRFEAKKLILQHRTLRPRGLDTYFNFILSKSTRAIVTY